MFCYIFHSSRLHYSTQKLLYKYILMEKIIKSILITYINKLILIVILKSMFDFNPSLYKNQQFIIVII